MSEGRGRGPAGTRSCGSGPCRRAARATRPWSRSRPGPAPPARRARPSGAHGREQHRLHLHELQRHRRVHRLRHAGSSGRRGASWLASSIPLSLSLSLSLSHSLSVNLSNTHMLSLCLSPSNGHGACVCGLWATLVNHAPRGGGGNRSAARRDAGAARLSLCTVQSPGVPRSLGPYPGEYEVQSLSRRVCT